MSSCKFHSKNTGGGFWEVFVTEDNWDTFSFMMRSEEQPTRKEILKVWRSEEKEAQKVF